MPVTTVRMMSVLGQQWSTPQRQSQSNTGFEVTQDVQMDAPADDDAAKDAPHMELERLVQAFAAGW